MWERKAHGALRSSFEQSSLGRNVSGSFTFRLEEINCGNVNCLSHYVPVSNGSSLGRNVPGSFTFRLEEINCGNVNCLSHYVPVSSRSDIERTVLFRCIAFLH